MMLAASTGAFYTDPTFYVAVAFVIFFGILLWQKVPATITKMLDARTEAIRKQLEDARALRDEAQALLSSYQRKQHEAEKEAQEIIDRAEVDAKRMAEDAEAALEESIARRTKMAEDKIAQAEAHAVAEVRNEAVAVAINAARTVIGEQLSDAEKAALVDQSIVGLDKTVH